jgi:hypothetical protein
MARLFNAVRTIGAAAALHMAFAVAAPGSRASVLGADEEPPPAPGCESAFTTPDSATACANGSDAATDRTYLVETATPGYTMALQGPDVAIGRLHPEFAHRLAAAIHDARAAGLPSAGIFSAYRPPAFGVGGFSDKFNSLHTYGLAVDMTGIGSAGSAEAKIWYEIAAKHGVVCPYGVENRVEWNHCQPTWVKIIRSANPLRETVTASGPLNLESMFEAGSALIDRPADHPTLVASNEPAVRVRTPDRRKHDLAHRLRAAAHPRAIAATHVALAQCQHEGRSHAAGCGAHHPTETGDRRQARSRQASLGDAHESRRKLPAAS